MARLAVLLPDPRAAARLRAALSDRHDLVECTSLEAFWERVMSDPVDGCIVDMDHPTLGLTLPELQRLRRRVPPLAIVVYADFTNREMDLFELGRLKIDGVILAGAADQPQETQRAMAGALATAAALGVTGALGGQIHPLGIEGLRWAIERAEDEPTTVQMAEALALAPAALARELRERRLPSPSRLLLWGRIFRAARLLENGDRNVEDIAFRLGYSSGPALARAFRRETGLTVTELRGGGALACTLDAFLRREVRGRAGGRV